MQRIYLDWNATTPPSDVVLDAMREAAREAWGNPASVHGHGRAARARVEDAREAVAAMAGVDGRDVVLTSGGTEANNLALRSVVTSTPEGPRPRILTSRIEHPSIVRTAEAMEREGLAIVRWLAVTESGHVDLEDVARALAEPGGAALASVQAVNHETGAIQPLEAIAALLPADSYLHVDAVQAWGKVAFATKVATLMSVAAHKLRGPKGIGALVTRPCIRLEPILRGGAQERGLRPGTVDPVAASGMGAAARAAPGAATRREGVRALRDRLEASILALTPAATVNGSGPRAEHVTNISFAGWLGPELVAALDLEGVSVSSGSACSAGTSDPSPVIEAMVGRARARSAVRFSLGETTSSADVDDAVKVLQRVLARTLPQGV